MRDTVFERIADTSFCLGANARPTSERAGIGGLIGLFVAMAAMMSGCAAMQTNSKKAEQQQASKIEKLQARIDDLKRQNGRLTTRIEELEDDIFLLQDRVEAHRLALKRQRQQAQTRRPRARQSSRRRQSFQARRPQQPPNTQYQPRRRGSQRNVTRIELNPNQSGMGPRTQRRSSSSSSNIQTRREAARRSGGTDRARAQGSRHEESRDTESSNEETIVITNEDFEKYSMAASGGQESEQTGSSGTSSESSAQPDVTDERLETTNGASTTSNQSDSAGTNPGKATSSGTDSDPALSGKEGLELYKASLSLYRQGDYGRARGGFKSFMEGNPRRDYQDNGLYWIGECEFGLGNFREAISLFQRVIKEHPGGNKVPDAMLKMALAYRELGDEQRASELLEKVASQYPRTNVGDLAKRKMK